MRRLFLPLISVTLLAACGGGTPVATDGGSPPPGDLSMTTPPGADLAMMIQPGTDMAGAQASERAIPLAPFTLEAGEEKILCYYVPPDGVERYISRFEIDMAAGSHHLVVMRIRDDQGLPATGPVPCNDLPNGFDGMLPGSQQPHTEWTFPVGVAMKLEKNHGIYFQSHYINATAKQITTGVTWKITSADPSTVKETAGVIFYSNTGIQIGAGVSVKSLSCKLPQALNLLTATGHMHKRGTAFDASVDGQKVYHTDSWDEPNNATFPAPGMAIPAGAHLDFGCTYDNKTGKTLKYGNSAELNEMCIFVGIFYPIKLQQTLFACLP
ncbi:MAG: hypothetical protein EXR72_21520 [Myxococcales bacterium]|nr:hypothetical protein [Myxococcales bacterium]